jgi:16S rRNA (cytosine967-C5)-methyltransferase
MSARPDAPRRAAFEVLKAVRVKDAYTNLVLPQMLGKHRLAGRDAAFATELAAGTIRRQGTYDAIVAACIDRPLVNVQAKALDVLRLGTHQLLAMRVAPHAAISTSVDLARSEVGPGAAKFVNAVLRSISVRDLDGWMAELGADLATRSSHPQWVVDALTEALGPASGEVEALLTADNESPAVTLVARPGRSERSELPGEPTPYSPYGVVLDGGDPGAVPAVAEGRAGVQDEGSQLVAVALAQAPIEGRDERWLDLCAGPGGKAALLAALADRAGARLVANEVLPHRAELVRRTLAGAAGLEEITTYDARTPPWEPGSFDRVLVDAPCTGLGALRRRPEARWRKQPADLDGLTVLQRDLLASALDLVRPGGVVLYATCSPLLAETRDVVSSVLADRPGVGVEPVPLDVPDSAGPLPGTVQLWPHRHRTDAMFIALLRRA